MVPRVAIRSERVRDAMGYSFVAGAAALWGCWSLFFRPAEKLQPVSPAAEAWIAFAATIVVIGPGAYRDTRSQTRSMRAWGALALLGLADAANVACFFSAMQRTSLAMAVLTHYLAPVFVALGEPWFTGSKRKASVWGAVAVALVGLALLLEPWRAVGKTCWLGAGLGGASAVFYALNVLMSKRLSRVFSQREIQAWHSVPGLLVLPWLFRQDGVPSDMSVVGVLVAGSLIIAVLGGWLFLRGLRRIPATHASILSLIEPVVAVLIGALVWREVPSAVGFLGAGLVLAAAWQVIRSR